MFFFLGIKLCNLSLQIYKQHYCIYIYTMHTYYRYVCLILGIHILYYMHRFNTWVNESGITQPHALKCSLEQEHSQNHQSILLRPFYVAQIYMNISRQADKRG